MVTFWECAGSWRLSLSCFPLPAILGLSLLLSRQLLVPLWIRDVTQELSLELLGWAGLTPRGLGRGEEQWNSIHTWEQKITCICHCFHMDNVGKILERRILIPAEEKGEKSSFGSGCLDPVQELFWGECLFLVLLVTQ